MKILVTLHNFPPSPCFGAERVAMRQMREMARAGHDVCAFFAGRRDPSPGELEAEGLAGIRCVRVPFIAPRAQVLLSIARPRAEAAFARALAVFQPDVILFHHLVRLSLRLPEMARRHGCPSVLVLHDQYLVCPSYSLWAFDGPVCPAGSPSRCARCLWAQRFGGGAPVGVRHAAAALLEWRRRLVPRQVAAVDAIVAPSRSVIHEIEARGVALPGATVIPNGSETAQRRAAGPAGRAPRFGFLGAPLPKKGIDVLAQACAGTLSARVTVRGFADRAAAERFREAHPGFDAVLEPFSEDVAGFMDGIDVLVVPSIWLENQPTVIIEAFAHGRPVVASRIGGIPEMLDEGRGGWLEPPGDPAALRSRLEALTADPQAIARAAEQIPTWPTWPEVTSRVVGVLEDVVARHRRTSPEAGA